VALTPDAGRHLSRLVLLLAALLVWRADPGARPQPAPPASACGVETTERIVAVGDVHGAYDQFTAILREAGLIDARQRWVGGRAILVQTGDVLDRGPDSRRALDLLRRLEVDAAAAGGRVIALLGNHEVMRMLGDVRYVSAGEYAAFRSRDAVDLRERLYSAVLPANSSRARERGEPFDEHEFRRTFLDQTPLGSVEMQIAFAKTGEYGRRLRARDTMAVVNGVVFLHGGTTAAVAAMGCAAVNAAIRSQLQTVTLTDPDIGKTLLAGADGPLWYRGLVDEPPAVTPDDVDGILHALHATAIVVSHTVAPGGRMRSSFGGRVIQVDTGMLGGTFYPDGGPSALEIREGTFTAIYPGQREVLTRRLPVTPRAARR
jgi:hypothetical protein